MLSQYIVRIIYNFTNKFGKGEENIQANISERKFVIHALGKRFLKLQEFKCSWNILSDLTMG